MKTMRIVLAGLLLVAMTLTLTACTITEYGMPYNYGSTMEAHSEDGRWQEYQHYRSFGPGFGNNSMDPHLR